MIRIPFILLAVSTSAYAGWLPRQSIPSAQERKDGCAFTLGTVIGVATGYNGAPMSHTNWYDPVSNAWIIAPIPPFPGSNRTNCACGSNGAWAFIALGSPLNASANGSYNINSSLYNWYGGGTPYSGSTGRYGMFGAVAGNGYYIGGGHDGISSNYDKDFWFYDFSIPGGYTQRADIPSPGRIDAFTFCIGNDIYVGGGVSTSQYLSDFYRYDPSQNTWTPAASLMGGPKADAVAFVINNKGYMGLGENIIGGNVTYYTEFYVFDPTTQAWATEAPFPANAREGAVGASLNGKGYVGLGFNSIYYNDWWEFTPSATGLPASPALDDEIYLSSNITDHLLTLRALNPNERYIALFLDLDGRCMARREINGNSMCTLDIRFLPQGHYLLQLAGKQERRVFKFVTW